MSDSTASGEGAVNRYETEFVDFAKKMDPNDPEWLSEIRSEAIAEFAKTGFPTVRDEKWRFTNFSRMEQAAFRLRNGRAVAEPRDVATSSGFNLWGNTRLVFVDGKYAPELSSTGSLPSGVYLGVLGEAVRDAPPQLQEFLGQISPLKESPFTALNAAFMSLGAVLVVQPHAVVQEPIHLVFLSGEASANTVSHVRNLIAVGEGAQLTTLESYVGVGAESCWTNSVTELSLGDSAVLKSYRTQLEGSGAFHTSCTNCHQGRDSNYSLTTMDFGGQLSRHDIGVRLAGSGAHCDVFGLVHLRDKQHADNHTWIDHAEPHCTSNELFNGVFEGESHGVFTGRIMVREGAQRTDALQSSRNLLLSETARADAQPQLEIFADDVRCTHGATVGPIDPEALFYLRSKGLSEDEARSLLTFGFAAEILNSVEPDGWREELELLLRSRLQGN